MYTIKKNPMKYKDSSGEFKDIGMMLATSEGGGATIEQIQQIEKNKNDIELLSQSKLDIDQGIHASNHFVWADENGQVVTNKPIIDIMNLLSCRIRIDINLQDRNGVIVVMPSYSDNVISYNLKLNSYDEAPTNNTGSFNYYILSFDGLSSSEQVNVAINNIITNLKTAQFKKITFYEYVREVYAETNNFLLDSYGGVSFTFGKSYVRINTNYDGNGGAEPT